jgi:TRAP-type transport system periplasmic protein
MNLLPSTPMLRLCLTSLATAALLLASQCAVAQSQVLKLNHTDTPSGSRHKAAELFARRFAQLTKGRFRVLVFHSGQLGNDPQNVQQVSKGELDLTVSSVGSFASLVPTLNLTSLPYLVNDYEHGWRLYDQSPWIASQFELMPAKGMRVVATWEAGFRSFTTKTPLRTPDDAKGKKMRIFNNDMLRSVMTSIGYEPVVMPVTEVYQALQQGKVEGQENPIDTIQALRFYEVAPHITLTQHSYGPLPFVVSETLWQKLSSADRDAMKLAGAEAAKFSRLMVRDNDQRQLEEMKAAGAIVSIPKLALFRKAVEPVYVQAREKYGADVDALLSDTKRLAAASKKGGNY